MRWTLADVDDLHDTWTLLTGVTGGLGYHVALELARKGGNLILAVRDQERVREIVEQLHREAPGVTLDVVPLDLAELTSVRAAADLVRRKHQQLDLLINNAGVMGTPQRTTADGFELQMGTNHIGHFALTARLWPLLSHSGARIVTVSSLLHSRARDVDQRSLDPAGDSRRYRRWRSYSESKLANLMFSQELHRRMAANGETGSSVAAHPGLASTKLTVSGPELDGRSAMSVGLNAFTRVFAQPAHAGAWPILMAATAPYLAGGSYVGPSDMRQMRGQPRLVGMSRAAQDPERCRRLWAATEQAIGERFPLA